MRGNVKRNAQEYLPQKDVLTKKSKNICPKTRGEKNPRTLNCLHSSSIKNKKQVCHSKNLSFPLGNIPGF